MKKLIILIMILTLFPFVAFGGGAKEGGGSKEEVEKPAATEVSTPTEVTEPVTLKFGAMRIGTAWYIFAATITKLLEEVFPTGSVFEVVPQGGGIANPLAVSQGRVDIALANVATSKWAYDGIIMYEGKQAKNIRALVGGLNKVWIVIMFRKEFIDKTGIDSLEKIAEKKYPIRLICKPEGSTVPPITRLILAEYGMSFDKIKEWGGDVIQVSASQIPAMMRDGRADVWFETAVMGHPAVTEGMLTANLKMIGPSEKVIKALAKYGLYEDTMPAGLFHGQDYPIKTVMPGTVIIARDDLPENVAYLITKTICENKEALVAAHKAIKAFIPEKAGLEENRGIPLHPGAERYYREKGWLK